MFDLLVLLLANCQKAKNQGEGLSDSLECLLFGHKRPQKAFFSPGGPNTRPSKKKALKGLKIDLAPLAYFWAFIHNLSTTYPQREKKDIFRKRNFSGASHMAGRCEHLAKFWFKKGHSGNPAGPKPDRIRAACKELLAMNGAKFISPLTANEIRSFCQMLLSLPTNLAEELEANPKTPGGVRSLVRGLLKDMQLGKITTVLTLMDRAFGPINRKTEVTLLSQYEPDDGKDESELKTNLVRMADAIINHKVLDGIDKDGPK